MKRRDLFKAVCCLTLFLFINGCTKKCDEKCDDCAVLDPETCECVVVDVDCACSNGKIDGDELYIDCGGSCEPCECEYDPCLYLTGGDDKVWIYVNTVDSRGVIIEPTNCDRDWTYTFFVEHLVEMGCPQDQGYSNMRWEFDDPEEPLGLVFTDGNGNQYGYSLNYLSADTLQILEGIGLSTYIPE
jgi:hypothetical protein